MKYESKNIKSLINFIKPARYFILFNIEAHSYLILKQNKIFHYSTYLSASVISFLECFFRVCMNVFISVCLHQKTGSFARV